ncbi:arginine/serine-rich protein PNISR-like [Portunus trituberculatus]|uniref:arginine/serine-rich protein PNISR-like n=1 Tax=Portunus trituberculatus TaxID=210409 RepID=UPI001E1CBA42|nr:arginine/serine-rich protein PNISR-like [Portunus trituberculatus]
MVSECYESLIERPSGISGYRPASWRQNIDVASNTGQLRVKAGINDPVSPCVTLPAHPAHPSPPPTDSTEEESDDDLDDIQREELKQLVRNLRRDLASTKKQLNYRCIRDYLVDRRRKLVEELSTVDTLLATLTFEEKQQRSIACTARPHNIVAESETATRAPTPSEDSHPPSQPSRSPTPTRSSSPPPSRSPPASAQHTLVETESSPPLVDTSDSATNDESGAERQYSSHRSSQGTNEQRRQPRKKRRPATRGTTPQSGQQPRQEAIGPRLQQARCPHCRRHGHTQEQCPRKVCDYCQGRSHSSLYCRVKIADERQKELVQAVRQTS